MRALRTIGLGGDGDEVDAIERVEAEFGILFDIADCERFVTVEDVWRALVKETNLGETSADADEARPKMIRLLGEETLAEHQFYEVGPETRLIP